MKTISQAGLIPSSILSDQEQVFPIQEQAIQLVLFRCERSAADILNERTAESFSVINVPVFIP